MLIDVRPMLTGEVRRIQLGYLTPPPEDFNDIEGDPAELLVPANAIVYIEY